MNTGRKMKRDKTKIQFQTNTLNLIQYTHKLRRESQKLTTDYQNSTRLQIGAEQL